jgi:ribose 5-phosphate isomerase A
MPAKAGIVVSGARETFIMTSDQKKQLAAMGALEYLQGDALILGIGTGSTVNIFIDALAQQRHRVKAAVSSSNSSTERLRKIGIEVVDLNDVGELALYIDGADEATRGRHLIKGGGAALTREKIVAAASQRFLCMIDDSKLVEKLGKFPLPVEVVPMARRYVAGRLEALGGRPVWREKVVTDNGNHILDVHGLDIGKPEEMEGKINQIVGVVTNGLFANRPADTLLIGTEKGLVTM